MSNVWQCFYLLALLSACALGSIKCSNYLSCTGSSINSSTDLFCRGAYSCYQASQISVSSLSNAFIECSGLFACGFISQLNLFGSWGIIYCRAQNACYKSIIHTNKTEVWCYGVKSCSETIIYVTDRLFGFGYLSLENSQIVSNATITNYDFYGAQCGKGATITCNYGHACYIYCAGDGCDELTLNGNGTVSVYCHHDAYKSSICPNGITLASFIDFKIPNLNMSTIYNNSLLYQSCDYTCQNDSQCASKQIDFPNQMQNNTSNYNICCIGSRSCKYSNWQLGYGDNDYESNIRCDAYKSCEQIELRASNNTYIYATGRYSLWDTDIYNGTIYCLGYVSCSEARLYFVESVCAYGMASGYLMNVIGVKNSVYCYSQNACSYASIAQVKGNVYASGRYSLNDATIRNVLGSVIGIGYEVLHNSTIVNAANVCKIYN